MRGQYAWQWTDSAGELVVLYNGNFELSIGRRRLTADDAVIWILPQRDTRGRTYHLLHVYLSGNAEVRESAGTSTVDEVLLVSNLRTYGEIYKSQDAHANESAENTDLYKKAAVDRARVEGRLDSGGEYSTVRTPEGARKADVFRPRPFVRYDLGNVESAKTDAGEPVYIASGGVYFASGGGERKDLTEIRAQNAVVFPAKGLSEGLLRESDNGGVVREGSHKSSRARIEPEMPVVEKSAGASGPLDTGAIRGQIRSVYLEGDVVLSSGSRFVRASRLYYDFELERAIILDSVFRADVPERGIPLYVRAEEIRQLSATEFQATNARVTTSEFYTPHYHVGVERLYLRDLSASPRAAAEGATPSQTAASGLAGTFEAENTTLNIENMPVLAWPKAEGRLDQSETLIRRFSFGYDGDFGVTVRTAWYLFNMLGIPAPPGVDATLRLDYSSDRGGGVGVNSDYQTDRNVGLLRTYYAYDRGYDSQLGPIRRAEHEPESDNRGRALWRHKQFLEDDWEVWLELSYVSDPNFLEIYERSEWFEGKEQETAIYLRRARGTEAISLLANWRLLDFVTQTEHLPDLEYRRIGDTLGDTPLVSYAEGRFGSVRYRPDDRRFFDERQLPLLGAFANDGLTDATFRVDGREELELPMKLGGLNLVPFGVIRGSYWDGQPFDRGGLWRGFGMYGLKGALTMSRVYDDAQSTLFDVNRIRHVVKPNFVVWNSHSNVESDRITPFDEGVETISDFYGAKIALNQVWQTKRGPADRQRSVDLVTLNLEVGAMGNQQPGEISNGYVNMTRPEDSRTRNYLAGDLTYRISDSTALLYDFNFDLNDRSYDRHAIAITVERNPRVSYVLGARSAGDIEMSLAGGGFNYKLSEKHITALRYWHDLDRNDVGELAFSYIRKLPRWYAGFNIEYDGVDDDTRVSLTLWPEGIPEWALGSRRFTGLSTSTGIRP